MTRLKEEEIENFKASVEPTEYVGLTEDDGKTAVIIAFMNRHEIIQ